MATMKTAPKAPNDSASLQALLNKANNETDNRKTVKQRPIASHYQTVHSGIITSWDHKWTEKGRYKIIGMTRNISVGQM